MHGLSPGLHHDHGASLDAASHGQYHPIGSGPPLQSDQSGAVLGPQNQQPPAATQLIHSLVDALTHRAKLAASASVASANPGTASLADRMPPAPDVSDLVELKTRLCLREGLNHDECDRALLPTLEHASLVHSHIHHLTDQSEEAFLQTRNAIVYISLVVVVYVIVVLWLVSANFRSSLAAMASDGGRRLAMGGLVGPLPHLRDDGELESLIVVRDQGEGKKGTAKCTTELDHEDDGEYV